MLKIVAILLFLNIRAYALVPGLYCGEVNCYDSKIK